MANSLAPSGTLPSFLQNNPSSAPQNYLAKLPGMFNTTGLRNSYQQEEAQNLNQGSAIAAAAANQYVQRARQSGASTLGAGFAQASAMLPVYQQNAAMNSDLQSKLLQYRSAQAGIGAGLSGDIGRLQGQQQSTLADYYLSQQRLQQSQSQFGQNFGLQQQQLAQQTANQRGQLNNQAAQLALQYAPRGSGLYSVDNQGRPLDQANALALQRSQGQQDYLTHILSGLGYSGQAATPTAQSPLPGPTSGFTSGVTSGGFTNAGAYF